MLKKQKKKKKLFKKNKTEFHKEKWKAFDHCKWEHKFEQKSAVNKQNKRNKQTKVFFIYSSKSRQTLKMAQNMVNNQNKKYWNQQKLNVMKTGNCLLQEIKKLSIESNL